MLTSSVCVFFTRFISERVVFQSFFTRLLQKTTQSLLYVCVFDERAHLVVAAIVLTISRRYTVLPALGVRERENTIR